VSYLPFRCTCSPAPQSSRCEAAKVTLVTDARKGGNFSVTGTTSNGPLTIAVPGSPVDNALSLLTRRSNGAAEVKLHGAYQGMFMVTTSNFSPVLFTRRLNETGDGRRIEYEGVRGGMFIQGRRIKIWGV
jgi:hypothetical protein